MKSTYYFKVQSIPGTNILCLSPVSLYFQLSISSLSTSTFCMYVQLLSLVQVFGTPLTVGLPGSSLHWIFQQEYWSRLPFPSPEDLSNPGIEPGYPTLQADFLPTELSGKPSLCRHSILSNTKQIRVGVCTHVHICSVMSDSFQPQGLYPARLLCPWNFPSKNTGAGCHFLLQGIFPTQGLTLSLLCLLHWL